jgi:membrane-associated phospholipid phosphatase
MEPPHDQIGSTGYAGAVLTSRPASRAVVAGLAALGVASFASRGRGRRLDHRVFRRINAGRGPAADAFFGGVTELGSIWTSVGATAALSKHGRRMEALDALGAAGATWVVGQALKRIYRRPRPYQSFRDSRLLVPEPRGDAWPSTHPAVLLAFLIVVTRNLDTALPVRAAAGGLAGVVGLSRVYLGVHLPSDVVGGMLLGRGVAEAWSAFVTPRMLDRIETGGGSPSSGAQSTWVQ